MILQILCILLICEFLFSLFLFKGDILAPAVAFSFVFVIASFDLLLMSNFWNVELHEITLNVIIVGVASFILGSYIGCKSPRIRITHFRFKLPSRDENYKLSKKFLDIAIVCYVVFIPAMMIYIIKIKGGLSIVNGVLNSYVSALNNERDLGLPFFLEFPRKFLLLAGYIWSYFLVNNWTINRKIEIRYIVLFLLDLVLAIADGSRGELVALVITMLVFLIFSLKKNGSRKMTRRAYFTMFLVLIAVAFSFQSIATMMGRDSDLFEPLEYFSIYLGAPILNLDTSICAGRYSHPVFLSETFHSLYTAIGENFGIESLVYDTDRIFWSSPNGKRVGNVATVFYDFYHDGGILCVIVMTFIMAFISSRLYRSLLGAEKKSNKIFLTLVYAYVMWLVVRSFFANSFYEWVTLSTIFTLCIWWLLSIGLPMKKTKRGL